MIKNILEIKKVYNEKEDYYFSSILILLIGCDKTEKIEKVTINGNEYEYYKVNYLKDYIIYVYRTKIANNDYYYFEFNVFGSDYKDSNITKFMETVEYLRYKK